jgi:hypothetical protein
MPKIKGQKDKSSLESYSSPETWRSQSTIRERLRMRDSGLPGPGRRPRGRSVLSDIAPGTSPFSIDQFKFLECDPITIDAEPIECKVCEPNPYAYVPDYTLMLPGEVYFDGKTCKHCIVLETAPPAAGGPQPGSLSTNTQTQRDIKEIGIRKLLEYYNKSTTATLYYYEEEESPTNAGVSGVVATAAVGAAIGSVVPGPGTVLGAVVGASVGTILALTGLEVLPDPVSGYALRAEERDVVKELLNYTELSFTIPIQKKARTKIAICIDAEIWARVPGNLISDPDTEFETNHEVTFKGSDLEYGGMFTRVAGRFVVQSFSSGGLRTYQKQNIQWRDSEGGLLSDLENNEIVLIDLEEEADLILDFLDVLITLLDEAGLAKGLGNPVKSDLENITLQFEPIEEKQNPRIRLKKIIVNKYGCPEVTFSEDNQETRGLFTDMLRKAPMGQSRTLYYIGALPEMDAALTAREPMPWLEFVLKFTYPGLQVYLGENSNTLLNNPDIGSCFANALVNNEEGFVNQTMTAISESLIGMPDEILDNICMTEEELRQAQEETIADAAAKAWEEKKNELTRGDPALIAIFEAFEKLVGINGSRKKIGVIWETLVHKLERCGWMSLMMKALDCVAQGTGREDFMSAITEAAVDAMGDFELRSIMLGLDEETQDSIAQKVSEEFEDAPLLWDPEYSAGSYSGPGFSLTPSAVLAGAAASDALTARQQREVEELLPEFEALQDQVAEGALTEEEYYAKSGELLYPSSEQRDDTSGGILGVGYSASEDEFTFGEMTPGSGNTYFESVGKISKEIIDAYRNALLDVLDADVLMSELNKLPGAPIVGAFIETLPCKPSPPWAYSPQWDSFLNTIEWDFCNVDPNASYEITIPKQVGPGLKKPNWNNLFKKMQEMVSEAVRQAAIAIIMAAIKGLTTTLFTVSCESLRILGANLIDLYEGSDHFRNLLAENLCPGADEETLNESLKGLFDAVGGPESDCMKQLSNSEMGDFIDDLSLMLTQSQILQLLKGTPSKETLSLAGEVARASSSPCIADLFSDPSVLKKLFSSLGLLMPLSDVEAKIAGTPATRLPGSPCPPDVLAHIEDLKCQLLSQKGLSPKECREELDKLKEKSIQDLKDLVNLAQKGPMADFPPLVSSKDCPNEGFYPAGMDPATQQLAEVMTATFLSSIQSAHVKDLLGDEGILNNLLADTKGRGWRNHSRQVRWLGAPLASQLGWFEWVSDNAILGPDGNTIDIYGNELTGQEGSGDSFIVGLAPGGGEGGYPPTVGAWMAKQFRELNPEFKTTTIPEGYSSLKEAMEEVNRKEKENAEKIESREKYIEEFIRENHLDDLTGTNEEERQLAYVLRKYIKSKNLFLSPQSGELEEEPTIGTGDDEVEISEQEKMVRNALMGEKVDCCSNINSWDITDGAETSAHHPRDWGEAAKARAGTDGQTWAEYWHTRGGAHLTNIPDILTPDVKLKYEGHELNDDSEVLWKYTIGYDYNLPDEDGFIRKGNAYKIFMDILQGASPSGGDEEDRKEKKSEPIVGQNDSIKEDDGYSWRNFEMEVESQLDGPTTRYINDLPASERVEDSWQIEAFYRLISKSIIEASTTNQQQTIELSESPEFREYFAQPKDGVRKLDAISSGFIKRLSNRISTGRSYPNPVAELEEDIDPDFLMETIEETVSASTKEGEELILEYIAPAFKHGYDPFKEPEIIELDNETYGGPLGKMFPDLVPPPFYVNPPSFSGWMEYADAFVPPRDGCDPARKAVFSLTDLGELATNLSSKLLEDSRIGFDPLCTQEAPYDKILDSFTAANVDAVLRAGTRVHIYERIIRAMPIFSQFAMNDDNFDESLAEFITLRIKRGLKADGESGWWIFNIVANDDDYYYRFIEQTFNTIVRKVDSGLINPDTDFTDEEMRAFMNIRQAVIDFYEKNDGNIAALSTSAIAHQSFLKRAFANSATSKFAGLGAGSEDFSKDNAEKAKQLAFELMIDETLDSALVFVKRMVKEELKAVGERFNTNFVPPIQKIDHLFLLSDTWIRGGVNPTGPLHVTSNPNDSTKYNISSGTPETLNSAITEMNNAGLEDFASKLETAFAGMDDWPFVLEKYIKIIEKPDPDAKMDRAENLYNVVNLEDWHAFVEGKKREGLSGKINDFWGTPDMTGETTFTTDHTHNYRIDEEGNGVAFEVCSSAGVCHFHKIVNFEIQEAEGATAAHFHELPVAGWKFGLRICYMPENDAQGTFNEIMSTIDASAVMQEKAYRLESPTGKRFLIPIAVAEMAIPDQEFTLFDKESYDVYCLIEKLVNSPAYKAWFRYVFPLPRFLSLLSIYCMAGFFDSLANTGFPSEGGDLWEKEGGGRDFADWGRSPDEVFKESKKAAESSFTALYETLQPEYDVSEAMDLGPTSFSELLRPLLNFEDGLRWWQRGRRVKNRPLDMDGKNCN